MAPKPLRSFLIFFLAPWTICFAQQKSFYGGVYNGMCGQDGIYYKDSKGFMSCSNNYGYYMRCPAGTRNPPASDFEAGNYYSNTDFCGVTVDIFGTTRDDFLNNSEADRTSENNSHALLRRGSANYRTAKKDYSGNNNKNDNVISSRYSNIGAAPSQFAKRGHQRQNVRRVKPNRKEQEKKRHNGHSRTSVQTQESPESYMRKVLEVSESARSKNRPQGHESSFESSVSERMEVSSKSGGLNNTPNSPAGPHGQHFKVTQKRGQTDLKEMSKVFEEPKGPPQQGHPESNKVAKSSTTHTYHHPAGIGKTYSQTMYHPQSNEPRKFDASSKTTTLGNSIASPAPIPEPPVVHFPLDSSHSFPGFNNEQSPTPGNIEMTYDFQSPVENQQVPYANNGISSLGGNHQDSRQNQEYYQEYRSPQNHINGNIHSTNMYHSVPDHPAVYQQPPRPADMHNYLHADFYGRSADEFKHALPYYAGAFNPQQNQQHRVYQSAMEESYSVDAQSNPVVTQSTVLTDGDPSHVHINTPFPFPQNVLNFHQNHQDFTKYASQFGYRPYYGIHGNPNNGHDPHRRVQERLDHNLKFLPIEGKQATLPVQDGDQMKDKSYSFKQESYSEKNTKANSDTTNEPSTHGTKSFMTQKSEYMNINGKTLKDYTSTVYGVHAI